MRGTRSECFDVFASLGICHFLLVQNSVKSWCLDMSGMCAVLLVIEPGQGQGQDHKRTYLLLLFTKNNLDFRPYN